MIGTRWARTNRWFVWLALALVSGACDDTTVGDGRGAGGNGLDEPPAVDASRRAPPHYLTAGDPCSGVRDCPALPGARCLDWPGGYCTAPCEPDGACEEGTCAALSGAEIPGLGPNCMRACETDRECRAGYACLWTIDGPVCAPAP